MIRVAFLLLLLQLAACATPNLDKERNQQARTNQTATSLLQLSDQQLSEGETSAAVKTLHEAFQMCDQNREQDVQQYASRSSTESLYYLLMAANENRKAVVVDITCAQVAYQLGYSFVELGDLARAKQYIEKALSMSPANAIFLAELGHIYQASGNFEQSLAFFQQAEKYADEFSPQETKLDELSRAKRGVGFSLIELGRLDEAEKKFNECLMLNPDDQTAISELRYIKGLRANSQ